MRQTARRVTVACCAWLAAFAATPAAMAAFPDQPIKILVGFPAGSTADLLARALGQKLSSQMGQPVIVDNRAGAGSSIAAEAVAHARGDGYTLLISTTANVINPAVTTGLKFDFARDLVPVALLAENPAVMIVPGNSSYAHLGDLINAGRATPGKMTFASSGNGTFTHLYGELFNQLAGIKLTHVPYKGSTQAMTDVIAGVVDLSFTPATPVLGQIKSGKLKALAVVAKKRMNSLPDVPTFAEAGIPGLDTALWFGLNAPAGTPRAVVDRLAAESQKALASADVQAQMAAQGIDVSVSSPAQFGELITRELKQWAQVVKTAGVKID